MQFSATLLVASSAPVIDFDGTAYVQLGIFLLLMLVLQPLLFKPWLETRERREEAIAGALTEAERLRGKADDVNASYDAKMKAARDEAQGIRNTARKESEASRQQVVASARQSAGRELEEARDRAVREAASAREALQSEIDSLAVEVAGKILGRAV